MRAVVEDIFNVTGRGRVVGALLLDGDIHVGDELLVEGTGNSVEVSWIDLHCLPVEGGIRISFHLTPETTELVTVGAALASPRTGPLTSAVPRGGWERWNAEQV